MKSMTNEERIAALEQEIGQLRSEAALRVNLLEGQLIATQITLARAASVLPEPEVLFAPLLEDENLELMFSDFPDDMQDLLTAKMQGVVKMICDMGKETSGPELNRLPE